MAQSLKDTDKQALSAIRLRIERLEQNQIDPHVKDWSGAYYGDVYFLLDLIRRIDPDLGTIP